MKKPRDESDVSAMNARRRMIYDEALLSFGQSGVEPSQLFDNDSYYRRDGDGNLIELCGSHPTLIHWPLAEYDGGKELVLRLEQEASKITEIAGSWNVVWVNPRYWHCTV